MNSDVIAGLGGDAGKDVLFGGRGTDYSRGGEVSLCGYE